MTTDAAAPIPLGEMGVIVSGEGVDESVGLLGRRRRERREWRGGRRSNVRGDGRVFAAVGLGVRVVAMGIVGEVSRRGWKGDS